MKCSLLLYSLLGVGAKRDLLKCQLTRTLQKVKQENKKRIAVVQRSFPREERLSLDLNELEKTMLTPAHLRGVVILGSQIVWPNSNVLSMELPTVTTGHSRTKKCASRCSFPYNLTCVLYFRFRERERQRESSEGHERGFFVCLSLQREHNRISI